MTSRLERGLVVGLALVLIVTVAVILVSTRATTERAALAQMEQVMTRVAFEASDEASAFLDPAERFAALTADLLEDGVFSESEPERFEEFLLDVLRQNPLQAGYYVGRDDGDFFYVSRNDEIRVGGTRTKIIEVDGAARTVTHTWRDASGGLVRLETVADDTYDPRSRPWYSLALEADGAIWTDPYVFFTSQQAGITTAAPIHAEEGRPSGVFGVDVEITQLSTILAGLPISERGMAFIVDATGQLVALSVAGDLGLKDGNTLRRATPSELNDRDIAAAHAHLHSVGGPLVEEPSFTDFISEGVPWRVSFEPFATARWPWTIAVLAPEGDFLAEVRATQNANTRLAVAVGLVALLVTGLLATGLTRPLASLRQTAEIDTLTGLGNRRALQRQVAPLLDDLASSELPSLGVVMIDIDRFKAVNDSYGHHVGDEVLVAVSRRMRRALRDEDILVRHGGEEFAALLPAVDAEMAAAVVGRLLAGIRGAPINTSAGPIPTTVSAGIAITTGGVEAGLAPLLEKADTALYAAKRAGRDQLALDPDAAGIRVAGGDGP